MTSHSQNPSLSSFSDWFFATRPKTLAAAFIPTLVGTALAFSSLNAMDSSKKIHIIYSIFALFSAIFIQIGTNFINDAYDKKKGADNEKRIGPVRVTKHLTFQKILFAGFLSFFIALVLGFPLVLKGGFPILALGLFSLLFGFLYTGGAYPLAYKGLGEIFVILFFGFGAVCGVHYLQTGFLNADAVIASLQIGLLATVLIAVNNLRDYLTDRDVNKLTLAARFGKTFGRFEILILFFIAYGLNFYWVYHQRYYAGFLPFLSLPLALKVISGIFHEEPSPLYNSFLGRSAGVQLLFGILLSIGLIL